MAKNEPNDFQFLHGTRLRGVTALNATMSDFSYGKHAHDDLALGVTLGGVQEFSCKGIRFQSTPGGIMLFNPGDVHNGNPGKDTVLRYTMLYIDPGEFLPLAGCVVGNVASARRFRETHFHDAALKSLILGMSREIGLGNRSRIEFEYRLYAIAKRLAQRDGVFQRASWTTDKDTLLLRVRDYINDNIAEDISIDDLSGVANMSKFHFIRLFRNQFGLTPHRYILNQRVNRARIALEKGTAPTDVAQEFVFFDVSHMNRHFKRIYGLTPKQYQIQFAK